MGEGWMVTCGTRTAKESACLEINEQLEALMERQTTQ